MNQTGRVISVTPKKTLISVIRESACGESCASCSAKCSLKDAEIVAETKPGINAGDTVIFEMAASKVLFAAFLVYITPLFALLGGYLIASFMGAGEGLSVIVGALATAVWFFVVHFIDKKLKKYYKHTIMRKLEGDC